MPLKKIKVYSDYTSDYAEESIINTDHIVSAVPKNCRAYGDYVQIKTINGDTIDAKCKISDLSD